MSKDTLVRVDFETAVNEGLRYVKTDNIALYILKNLEKEISFKDMYKQIVMDKGSQLFVYEDYVKSVANTMASLGIISKYISGQIEIAPIGKDVLKRIRIQESGPSLST